MRTRSRWFTRMLCTVVPALAVAGMASVASAQGPVCVSLNRGNPQIPPDRLRLVTTSLSSGFLSVVGERTPTPPINLRGVLSGSGVVKDELVEISLRETGIGSVTLPAGPISFLVTGSTHIRLDTTTLTGTFKSLETEVTDTGNTATEHFEGTATVVPCGIQPAG